MNNWDKIDKKRHRNFDHEIFVEYVKIACFFIASSVYLYFLFIHKG
jgi:hypothetical protein